MAIDVYWGSGSPYAWRVLLALEYKRLPYLSHLLQFSKQEHKSPQMLALNPRGRVPVLKDGDYVCFESLAILYYLDLKYPQPPIFGRTPEEAGTIMRVIDMVIFPGIQLLKRALERPVARELSSRFMPVEVNYPALGRWLARVAALPGYERTYPPHWR